MNNTTLSILFASLLILFGNIAYADEVLFPTTAAKIIEALQPTLQSKGLGSSKGLGDVVTDAPPKVAALIYFDTDCPAIKANSYTLLREYAEALKTGLASVKLEIGGHTDSSGPAYYNLTLSKKRAQAVKDFLVFAYAVEDNRLIVKGYGETQPIASNRTRDGQAKNRRVEFKVIR
ncbi:outer membrane protein OprF [Beggiatoa sp. PS]|nr:outer membrane protein OprF [Beggiatoa sp. PS]